ncbi:MAG: arylamine N-acetyltransferase [Actinobacteria bacterium]|nr:arylamine N-acetyltransferase [Actinomycetota bacterium]
MDTTRHVRQSRVTTLDPDRVTRYLARIGAGPVTAPTLDALARLAHAHVTTIPFENLDIHLENPISLVPEEVVDKLTLDNRGGFCYELNGAFAALLVSLGYEVDLLEARVFNDSRLGPRFDHVTICVYLDEAEWLVDVGFGTLIPAPIRIDELGSAGPFYLAPTESDWIDLVNNGNPQYRFDRTPHPLVHFAPTCIFHQTSVDSLFTKKTICTLPNERGKVTISGRDLIVTVDGVKDRREISDDDELRALYQSEFGMTV